jgi:uncharacterized membrane protein YidH (DUF202 family)
VPSYALGTARADVHRVRISHQMNEEGELTYRQATMFVGVLAVVCAALLFSVVLLTQP